jgi:hypothetical protein
MSGPSGAVGENSRTPLLCADALGRRAATGRVTAGMSRDFGPGMTARRVAGAAATGALAGSTGVAAASCSDGAAMESGSAVRLRRARGFTAVAVASEVAAGSDFAALRAFGRGVFADLDVLARCAVNPASPHAPLLFRPRRASRETAS